ncbi:nucleoside-diphosphate sugar epimerase/dehydratase [Micromonospora sp. NPDC048842]|uniref:nucleoside-diphosphate sugar epimerase/dehydratase n=1 Tax=unclassified Micromonospora TaxID=2617518 RepID=UPI0033CE9C97
MQLLGTSPSESTRLGRSHRNLRLAGGLLAADALAWIAGFAVAAWVRFEFSLTGPALARAIGMGVVAAAAHVAVSAVRRNMSGRHPLGSVEEMQGLANTALTTGVLLLIALVPMTSRPVPASTPLVGAAIALAVMLGTRLAYRSRSDRTLRPDAGRAEPVLLFGAGSAGQGLLRAMLSDPAGQFLPVGMLDDDPQKRHLSLAGVRVLGSRADIDTVVRRTGAKMVIFSAANADSELINEVRESTLKTGATFKILPSVRELVDHRITVNDVRDPDMADLLGRRQVIGDLRDAESQLRGRRILVTGAGGSIGSELCRQIMRADPGELMMLDRDESALHALQLSMSGRAMLDSPELILADLRDEERIRRVMAERRPDIVFHAAALKHLTLLQRHPGEAVKTNVFGTQTVLNACRDVARFVNISTDKAADPVSVLGYSKRITERLTANAAATHGGTFLSVRFGNVLSSRGSVVTAFRAQIEAGLPITVTHPDVTRYLMTVQEAVHLVLQAAGIGRDGEALVLDMGEPVRIDDIARQLASQAPGPVQIVYTGLRPGEKLHEALIGAGERDLRPLHPLISHVAVPPLDPIEITTLDPFEDPEKIIDRLAWLCGQSTGVVAKQAVKSTAPAPSAS